MNRANEIYQLERRIQPELERLNSGSDANNEVILRFYHHSVAEGLSLSRVHKRVSTVRALSSILGKRFEDATKDDLIGLVSRIERRKLSPWTKHDFKVTLKHFFRWLKGGEDGETPPEVKWIKSSTNIRSKLLKKDLLTVEEVNLIVENARDVQGKALFSMFYDSGRRPGEILSLGIGDVEFDSLGARLRVDGKMGADIVRICASAPRMATWLDNHPKKHDPDFPLWVLRYGGKVKQMSYACLKERLKRAAKRAGIEKRVWPYLFRHSRITAASTKLTYAELCHVFGWKQGSDMPQFYVHLAGDDRDNAFLIDERTARQRERTIRGWGLRTIRMPYVQAKEFT